MVFPTGRVALFAIGVTASAITSRLARAPMAMTDNAATTAVLECILNISLVWAASRQIAVKING
jgi:hypothetical protein